jgi:hypothetical protein
MAVGGAPNTPPNGPPPSNPQTAPNLVSFDPKQAVPQQPIYLQRNDIIGFNILSNKVTERILINYRFLTPEGEIKEGQFDTGLFNFNFFGTIEIYEGWLLSFAARSLQGATLGTWSFLQAVVFRAFSPSSGINSHAVIWQGFVLFNAYNGWPGTPAKEITDGAGTLRTITGTTPAAGAEINEVVPSNRRWTLLAIRAAITTSAAAANRFPGFQLDDGVNIYFQAHTNLALPASNTQNYDGVPGGIFYNDGSTNVLLPLPNSVLTKSAWRIKTNTGNIQAGDQWTAPQYVVAEWGLWDL